MKTLRTILLGSVLAVAAASSALAGNSISTTAAVTSDYRFRGISNSDKNFAAQAGVTFNHESGLYIGAWASTVNFRDNVFFAGGPETTTELDLYGGYTFDLGDLGVDISAVYYDYPNSAWSGYDYPYWEGVLKLSYAVGDLGLTGQVAYSPDFFGIGTDDGWYVAGGASYPVADWLSVSGNYGYQDVSGVLGFNYSHWDLGATATYKDLSFDVRYIDTDTACVTSGGDWCGSTVVATLSWAASFDIE